MKKHVLNESFGLNCRVFGIVSTQPFYRLAWDLKRAMEIDLQRSNDLEWKSKTEQCYAPTYRFYDNGSETEYQLVRNHASSGWLASELKTVDAFLVETNYSATFSIELKQLNQSKFVQYCFEIELPQLKEVSQLRLNLN